MFFRKIQSYIGAVVLAAFVGGCGGSTQGTGGITVEGRLLEIGGAPVSGALVTVVTTGDSALTDQNGGFVLQSDLPDINLLFESGETSASTVVSVTPTTRKVVATFRLDRERERVETENIELEEDSRDDDDPIEDDVDDDNGGDDDSIDDDSSDEDDSSGDDSSDDGENDGGDDDEFDDSPDGDDDGEGSEDGNSGNSGSGNSGSGSGGGSEREIRGVISAIGGNEVVVGGVRFVTNSSTEYRDENGAAVTVAYFSVGMEVKARGREIGGTLSLERLESEED